MYNKKIVKSMKGSKLLVVLLILASWSCQNQISEIDPTPVDDNRQILPRGGDGGFIEVNENDFLLMQIVPSTVSSNSTNKFVLVNNTRQEVYWNTIITLEYFENNKWQDVPITGDWIDIGYELYPGDFFSSEIITGDMNLYQLVKEFNNVKKGSYRMSVNITVPDVGRYTLNAGFDIL